MIRVLAAGIALALVGAGLYYASLYAGWRALHPAEFDGAGCALFHVMRGLEQDPHEDPANAPLVERCTRPDLPAWGLSQAGDVLRFDRPAVVRMRVDVIDMQDRQYSTYPTMILEFPYPAVSVAAAFRWRNWGGPQREPTAAEAAALRERWQPTWAPLFGEWSLGRGVNEVWLGGAAITDPGHCLAVTRPPDKPATCTVRVARVDGTPVEVDLLFERPMEWRLELLGLCRFGGVERRWPPLLRSLFGAVEYSDRGCASF